MRFIEKTAIFTFVFVPFILACQPHSESGKPGAARSVPKPTGGLRLSDGAGSDSKSASYDFVNLAAYPDSSTCWPGALPHSAGGTASQERMATIVAPCQGLLSVQTPLIPHLTINNARRDKKSQFGAGIIPNWELSAILINGYFVINDNLGRAQLVFDSVANKTVWPDQNALGYWLSQDGDDVLVRYPGGFVATYRIVTWNAQGEPVFLMVKWEEPGSPPFYYTFKWNEETQTPFYNEAGDYRISGYQEAGIQITNSKFPTDSYTYSFENGIINDVRDSEGSLVSSTFNEGSLPRLTIDKLDTRNFSVEYDSSGRLKKLCGVNALACSNWNFLDDGIEIFHDLAAGLKTVHNYIGGRLAWTSHPDGSRQTFNYTNTETTLAGYRLDQVVETTADGQTTTVSYVYDPQSHQLTTINSSNGSSMTAKEVSLENGLTDVHFEAKEGENIVAHQTMVVDPKGSVNKVVDRLANATEATVEYDDQHRLIKAAAAEDKILVLYEDDKHSHRPTAIKLNDKTVSTFSYKDDLLIEATHHTGSALTRATFDHDESKLLKSRETSYFSGASLRLDGLTYVAGDLKTARMSRNGVLRWSIAYEYEPDNRRDPIKMTLNSPHLRAFERSLLPKSATAKPATVYQQISRGREKNGGRGCLGYVSAPAWRIVNDDGSLGPFTSESRRAVAMDPYVGTGQ